MGKSGWKFDLGGLMEVVSKLDTTAVDGVPAVPEVRLIPLADIVDNKANFYAVDKDGLKPMAELQLILANSTARVLSNAEISKQAERMEVLLYQLKEEGYEFPGRMRDQVAAACRVSAPKLARLKVIRERLKAPEFLLLFEKDRLAEQAAYNHCPPAGGVPAAAGGADGFLRRGGGEDSGEVQRGLAVGAGHAVPGRESLPPG